MRSSGPEMEDVGGPTTAADGATEGVADDALDGRHSRIVVPDQLWDELSGHEDLGNQLRVRLSALEASLSDEVVDGAVDGRWARAARAIEQSRGVRDFVACLPRGVGPEAFRWADALVAECVGRARALSRGSDEQNVDRITALGRFAVRFTPMVSFWLDELLEGGRRRPPGFAAAAVLRAVRNVRNFDQGHIGSDVLDLDLLVVGDALVARCDAVADGMRAETGEDGELFVWFHPAESFGYLERQTFLGALVGGVCAYDVTRDIALVSGPQGCVEALWRSGDSFKLRQSDAVAVSHDELDGKAGERLRIACSLGLEDIIRDARDSQDPGASTHQWRVDAAGAVWHSAGLVLRAGTP